MRVQRKARFVELEAGDYLRGVERYTHQTHRFMMSAYRFINLSSYLIVLLFLITACATPSSVEVAGDLMVWHKVVLTFDGPATAEDATPNPFTDYRLDVTFTGPSGQVYRVPGFYAADGNAGESGGTSGTAWRVRFAPDEAGEWRYAVSFVSGPMVATALTGGTSAGYMDGETGTFNIQASDKSPTGSDFRGKGKLVYVGEHFLQFKGTEAYFLKGGANSPEVFLGYAGFDGTPTDRTYEAHIQDWQPGDPTWHSEKGKGLIGMVNYLVSLDNNVFYFLTMNAEGDGKQVWPWIAEEERWRYDVSKLDQWAVVFEHMDHLGMMKNMVLTETENESYFEWYEDGNTGGFAESRKLYYREMVARFGYLLGVTWNVGEENGWADYSGDDGVKKANTTEQRKQFADYIRALTYYDDHIVVHNGPSEDYHIFERPGDNLLGHPSYTGPSLQGDFLAATVHRDVLKFRRLSAESGHKWVVTMDEPYITPAKGTVDQWRKDNVWAMFMAGGAGIELYIGEGRDVTEQSLREYEPYYETTATALRFFNEHVPFWDVEPDDNFVANAWTLKQDGAFYLFYFKDGGTATVELPEGEYGITWFDPRTGELHDGSVIRISGGASQALGTPPHNPQQDWVCMVRITS